MQEEIIKKLEGYKHDEKYKDTYSTAWNEAIEQAIEIIKETMK